MKPSAALLTLLVLAQVAPGRGPHLMRAEADRAYERSLATGRRLWSTKAPPLSASGQSCSGCHGGGLPGVQRKYPRHEERLGRFVTLEEQVARCISQRMRGQPPAAGSPGSVALLVFLKESR